MKIIVRMMGGLGNQLFQYAYARYLMTINSEADIFLDLSEYKTYKIRDFELDFMVLNEKVFKQNKKESALCFVTRKNFHLYQYLYRKFKKKPLLKPKKYFNQKGLIYSGIAVPENPLYGNENYLYGYFQDVSVTEPIRKILLEEFQYTGSYSDEVKKYMDLVKQSKRSLAVSVRCGQDYVESDWPVCSKEYYHKALEILKKDCNFYNIFIFADDIEKVKIQYGFFEDVTYIENLTPVESLEIMKNCDDFVISNSSFSWWGAYLSSSNNKRIIVPEKWFNGLNTDQTPLFLQDQMEIIK